MSRNALLGLIQLGLAGQIGSATTPPLPDESTMVRLSSLGWADGQSATLTALPNGMVWLNDFDHFGYDSNGDVLTNCPKIADLVISGHLIHDWTKSVAMTVGSWTLMPSGHSDWTMTGGLERPWARRLTICVGAANDRPANLITGRNFTGNTLRYNSNTTDDGGRIRGFRNMGGQESHIAWAPDDVAVAVNGHLATGDKQITLSKGVDWKKGMVIAIPPTGYLKADRPVEYRTLSEDTNGGNVVKFTDQAGLGYFRWGRLQYIVDGDGDNGTGMSLTPGAFTLNPAATVMTSAGLSSHAQRRAHADQESEQDLRCYVMLLSTSSCEITCPNDDMWKTYGYGVHIMQMGDATQMNSRWKGVYIYRYGHRGRHARYGFHFHNMSWDLFNSDGTYMTTPVLRGAVNSQSYFRKIGFHQGENRTFVIHNTNGVETTDLNLFGGVGTALFHEDMTERRNVATRVMWGDVKEPLPGMELKGFDTARTNGQYFGPQGLWAANLDNDFIGCRGYAIGKNGVGWAHPMSRGVYVSETNSRRGFGDAKNVPIDRFTYTPGIQDRCVVQGCSRGRQMVVGVIDEEGVSTELLKFETKNASGQTIPTEFGRFSIFYCGIPYQNQANMPTYRNWTVIGWNGIQEDDGSYRDGSWLAFSGSTNTFEDSGIFNAICIGHDLYDDDAYRGVQIPFASYHNTIPMPYTLAMNLGISSLGVRNSGYIYWSSVVATEDLYLNGIHKGLISSPGMRFYKVRVMDRAAPSYAPFITSARYNSLPSDLRTKISNNAANYNRTFAAPIPDPDGNCGFGAGMVNLLNHPHWTTGLTVVADPNNDTQVYTSTRFIGVSIDSLSSVPTPQIATTNINQRWSRVNKSTNAVIAESVLDYGDNIAPNPQIGRFLIDAVPEGEWLRFDSSNLTKPLTYLRLNIDLFMPDSLPILLTFPWGGAAPQCGHGVPVTNGPAYATIQSLSTLDLVKSSTTSAMWWDSANKEITFKVYSRIPTVDRSIYGKESTYQFIEVSPA
jgi:hypothetical protein